jgi:hypothetical protein
MIVQFPVKSGSGVARIAECALASHRDLSRIADWPSQAKGLRDSVTKDSLEFASHASKRWSFYHEQGLAVSSVATLKRRILADENAELALLIMARAKWANPSLLGLALARRTWKGNVILDFLATHPLRIAEGPDRISGIGRGLLYGLSEVTLDIGAGALWAESTKASAPIYKHVFGLQEVHDLLRLEKPDLLAFREKTKETIGRTHLH